jgi:hypothetical protein
MPRNDSLEPIRFIKSLRIYYISPYCRNCGYRSKNIYNLSRRGWFYDYIDTEVILSDDIVEYLMLDPTLQERRTLRLVGEDNPTDYELWGIY